MSLEFLTICSLQASGSALSALLLGTGVMEQGSISDLAAAAFLLCSAALEHQYLMQCLPFLLLQLPQDLSTPSCIQHVLLPLTYGTQNFSLF